MYRTVFSELDGTVVFGAFRVGWGGFSTLINIMLIARFVSPETQGYFYTFYSFFQLQALTQAGFYTALLAELSHAWTRVRVLATGRVEGERGDIERLGGLLRLSWRWHVGCAVFFAVVLIPVGYLFFSSGHDVGVSWQLPWLAMSLAIAASFLILPDGLTLESSSRTSRQQRHLLTGTVVASLFGFAALALGAGLYTPTIITISRVVLTGMLLRRETRPFRGLPAMSVDWHRKILPLQMKISISWLLGFIVYFAFVPVAFRVSGPVVAGHLGIVMQIFQAVTAVGGVWLTRGQPLMGALAAKGLWLDLHRLTKKIGLKSMVTAALASAAALAGFYLLKFIAPQMADRFGPVGNMIAFLLVATLTQYVSAMVSAVRMAKEDGFYYILGAAALAVVLGEVVFTRRFGEVGYGLAFMCGIMLVSSPSETVLYYRFIAQRMVPSELEVFRRGGLARFASWVF